MSLRSWQFCGLLAVVLCVGRGIIIAQAQPGPGALPNTAMPSVLTVPPEAQAGPNFNVDAATNAYLAQIPAEKRAKSDAYFEGGYWLILWDFLIGVVVSLLLLNLRWSAAMRNLAERITRFKPIQTFIYLAEYLVLTTILVFPMTVYEGYSRGHKYGLSTPTFGPMAQRSVQEPASGPGAGRYYHGYSLRYRSQTSAHLVDLGCNRRGGV